MAAVTVDFSEAVGEFPPYVEQPFSAGLKRDVKEAEAVLEDMKSSNLKIQKATDEVGPKVREFKEQATHCEGWSDLKP